VLGGSLILLRTWSSSFSSFEKSKRHPLINVWEFSQSLNLRFNFFEDFQRTSNSHERTAKITHNFRVGSSTQFIDFWQSSVKGVYIYIYPWCPALVLGSKKWEPSQCWNEVYSQKKASYNTIKSGDGWEENCDVRHNYKILF
jgi:hypothetical protein